MNGDSPRRPVDSPGHGAETSVHWARGSVRDAISGVRNLAQLLRSVRVGPKALRVVIPDVHAAVTPMLASTRRLLSDEASLGDANCRAALLAYLEPRMGQLESALAQANSGLFRASHRLTLEKVVAKVIPELDGALGLVDFLMETIEDRRVHVDVAEMCKESATILEGTQLPCAMVSVRLQPPASTITVDVNARATMALLTLGVSIAGTKNHDAVDLGVALDSGRCRIELAPAQTPPDAPLEFVAPIEFEPTVTATASLARATGVEFATQDGKVLLSLPVAV